MINNLEFSNRLKIIMEYYQLSASSFADAIGVQRSSISHLLSGRNKPSLDFVLKVVKAFEEVELYWLLNGKGNFPNSSPTQVAIPTEPSAEIQNEDATIKSFGENMTKLNEDKAIERIVLFYTDGTFKEYIK